MLSKCLMKETTQIFFTALVNDRNACNPSRFTPDTTLILKCSSFENRLDIF